MNRPLKALLLDLDGTVADTQGLIYESYCHTVRAHLGVELDRQVWEESLGQNLWVVFAAAFRHLGRPAPPEALNAAVVTYRGYMEANDAGVRAFAGIPETLDALRQRGVRLAIVTTKHTRLALRHLGMMRLTEYFDAVVTGDQCAHYKPHPEPFLKALAALGISAEFAAGVGDTDHDIHGARAAGLLALGAGWGAVNRPSLLAAMPDALLERPEQLGALNRFA